MSRLITVNDRVSLGIFANEIIRERRDVFREVSSAAEVLENIEFGDKELYPDFIRPTWVRILMSNVSKLGMYDNIIERILTEYEIGVGLKS